MLSKLSGESGLIIKSEVRCNVGNGFSRTPQLVTGSMDAHLDDVLLRRGLEMLFELPLELTNGKSTFFGESGNGNLTVKVGTNVIQGR